MLKDRHLIVPDGGLLKGLRNEDEILTSFCRLLNNLVDLLDLPMAGDFELAEIMGGEK